jgi:hypothetical protein
MNAQLAISVLFEPLSLYMRFQQDISLTFDYKFIVVHAQDNSATVYTKIVIDESEMDFYVNAHFERRTYKGSLIYIKILNIFELMPINYDK